MALDGNYHLVHISNKSENESDDEEDEKYLQRTGNHTASALNEEKTSQHIARNGLIKVHRRVSRLPDSVTYLPFEAISLSSQILVRVLIRRHEDSAIVSISRPRTSTGSDDL